jgi:cytochrome c biogenesis protein
MTDEVHTRPLPPAAAKTPPTAAASPSAMDRVDRGLEGLWHFLSSMRLAMVLMLLIAAMGVIGSLVIQAPPGVVADPTAKADWLDGIRPRFGGWTDIMNSLQLFEIFNSVVFRVLVAALTISLIACSIHRTPGMIRTATKPRVDVGPAFFEHAPQHEAIVARRSAAEAQAAVEAVLRARRFRTLAMDDGVVHVYADRYRWLSFSGLIAHVAIVVILAGAIIGGAFGYRDSNFTIAEGATRDASLAEAGLSMKLVDFADSYDTTTGAPTDYVSKVIVYKDGQEIDRHELRVNDPYRYGGTTFYQASFGSAPVMTIKDESGKVLASEGIPYEWQVGSDEHPLAIYPVPNSDKVVWIVGTTGGADPKIKPGQVEVQVYNSGDSTPVDSKVIDQRTETTVAGLALTFERESQFTRLNVAKDPGVMLVWLGALLLFGGFAIRFLFPHKRLWGRIETRANGGAVVKMATLTQKDVSAGTEFEKIVTDIRAALQAPAQS